MRKSTLIIFLAIIALLIWAGIFYWQNLRGVGPAIKRPPEDISQIINTTGMPLKLPDGFSIEIFAKDLPGARVLAFDDLGGLWLSQTNEGKVTMLEIKDGKVIRQNAIFTNLQKPHGLLFGSGEQKFTLYIAEENRVSRVSTYSEGKPEKLFDLPSGGGHYTRTIMWLPGAENEKMLVSVGSSCNVCNEKDNRRAKILIYDLKTKKLEDFAIGLRNSVFMAAHPETKKIWATEMGRDLIGDDIPPDEINIIEQGSPSTGSGRNSIPNFGWPNCYGKNIHDTSFDKNVYVRAPCSEPFETKSHIDLQAHSAPLGLAFFGGKTGFLDDFKNDLLVSFHGSWNRSVPTGYKVVRYKLDNQGKVLGMEDFITGWLKPDSKDAYGRPVDIQIQPGGKIYISDDKAGVIYRVNRVR